MADSDVYRAHRIIFGRWQAGFSDWFSGFSKRSSIPIDGPVADELKDALFEALVTKEFEADVNLTNLVKSIPAITKSFVKVIA